MAAILGTALATGAKQNSQIAAGRKAVRQERSTAASSKNTRVRRQLDPHRVNADSQARKANEERVIDLSEMLKGAADDAVYEDESDSDSEIWEHEKRFVREAPQREATAQLRIKGVLDPNQADILSAYSTEQGFREMDVNALAQRLEADPSVNLIDVRTEEEFSEGHVAGARNLSLDRLSEAVRAGSLSPEEPVTVICARGGRSAQACVRLSKVFAFGDVTNVKGGMGAWVSADLPVETGAS